MQHQNDLDQEQRRLQALHRLQLLDTPPEPRFDRLTRLAKNSLGVPIALISLVDAHRQWFKSSQGLDLAQTDRSVSFCGHAIRSDDLLIISDTHTDARFRDNPLVTGPPHIRFYAGAPVRTAGGERIGTLCVIDHQPRDLSNDEQVILRDLADAVERELTLVEQERHHDDSKRLTAILEGTRAGTWEWNLKTGEARFNSRWAKIIGYSLTELAPTTIETWFDRVHPEDHERLRHKLNQHLTGEREQYAVECRLRHKAGHWVWVNARGRVVTWTRDDEPEWMVGTHIDITWRKTAELEQRRSEKKLAEREKLLRTIIDNIPINIYVKDRDGRKVLANRSEVEFLGFTDEADVVGKHDADLFSGHLVDNAIREDDAVINDRQIIEIAEDESTDSSGKPTWFRVSKFPLIDDTDTVTGLVGISIDITEEKLAKDQTQRQLEALTILNEIAADTELSLDARLQHALQLGADYLGMDLGIISRISGDDYQVNWFIGPDSAGLTQHQHFELGQTYCRLALQNHGELAIHQMRSSPYAGHPCYTQFGLESYIGVAIHMNDGLYGTLNFSSPRERQRFSESEKTFVRLLARWIGAFLEREKAGHAIKDSESRLRALFELAPIGIALMDLASGRLLDANQALLQQSRYEWTELQTLTLSNPTTGEISSHQNNAIDQLRRQGRYGPIEQEHLRGDGTRYPVLVSGVLVEDKSQGEMVWTIVEDISDRKRIERLKNEFVSTVSHELRTPLTSIGGALKLLAQGVVGALPDKAQELVDIAEKNSQRLTWLVNDLLDIDKLLSGEMTFNWQRIHVDDCVRQSLQHNQSFADRFGIVIQLEPLERDLFIRADAYRLEQVLTNLLSNAVKFSPPGGHVILRVEHRDHQVRLQVIDRGPGIPEAFQPMLFQRFAQADASDSRNKGGTGLGLAISRELVTRMGGQIGFDTEVDKGTAFYVDFPVDTNDSD